MIDLIDFESYPVNLTKKILLKDKATKQNIIWATSSYENLGYEYSDKSLIQTNLISGINKWIVQPRIQKSIEQQQHRTRTKAEVFTPAWICNKMNNLCDEQWFGKPSVFNTETDNSWQTNTEKIIFTSNKSWQEYVDLRRLEITCGEAPYLCSRYNMSNGEVIPLHNRIGMLDRKIRIVNENATDKSEWIKWTVRAFQSCYGYEFQGDSLLIARINMLLSFYEYYENRWNEKPDKKLLKKVANIISWNLWQMDGLQGTVPIGVPDKVNEQLSFENLLQPKEEQQVNTECYLRNWRADRALYYSDLKGVKRKMKFDFVIGNPPYQDEVIGDNKTFAPPVYDKFLEESYNISNVVEMIHPARFLFNAGSTPKQWNKKMLNDEHLKIIYYNQDSSQIFANTDIKGGIAITYHDNNREFGAIKTFTPFEELNSIMRKIITYKNFKSIMPIVFIQTRFNLNELFKIYPNAKNQIGSYGKDKRLEKNIFIKVSEAFYEEKQSNNDISVIGIIKNKRVWRYIPKQFIDMAHENLNKYKVILPTSNGSGAIGEVLSTPLVGTPLVGYTRSFIGIGAFDCENEAYACLKYIKSKFARTALGILKITQDNNRDVWKYVPLQDFTENSDIDWSKSIHEIDLQLYKKYNFDEAEIEFIETHVKEMS